MPFIDRRPERYWRRRPVAISIAGAALLVIAVLTFVTATTSAAEHL